MEWLELDVKSAEKTCKIRSVETSIAGMRPKCFLREPIFPCGDTAGIEGFEHCPDHGGAVRPAGGRIDFGLGSGAGSSSAPGNS